MPCGRQRRRSLRRRRRPRSPVRREVGRGPSPFRHSQLRRRSSHRMHGRANLSSRLHYHSVRMKLKYPRPRRRRMRWRRTKHATIYRAEFSHQRWPCTSERAGSSQALFAGALAGGRHHCSLGLYRRAVGGLGRWRSSSPRAFPRPLLTPFAPHHLDQRRRPFGVPRSRRASPAQPAFGGRFGRGAEPPSEFASV
jgi:hypothetical protein